MKLSATQLRNLKIPEKTTRIFDGGGLYLEVNSKGGKYWRLKYRFLGKEKRMALGVYPTVSLKVARERREEAKRLISEGIDPFEKKKEINEEKKQQLTNTFHSVAEEWYAKKQLAWSEQHARKVLRRLEVNVFPWLGDKPIANITARDILSVLRRVEDRGAIETAHRALWYCSQIFRYGVAIGKLESDPSRDLRGALAPMKVNHRAAITDPIGVGKLMRAIDSYQGTIVVECALRLAPLVFVRPGELRQAKWADIDLKKAEWRFTVSKTKTPHVVPLSKQAISILKEIQPVTGKGEFVFPSQRTRKRPMSENAVLLAFRTMGISKEEMTGHGFRAMARTLLDEELGFRPDFIEHQLAHAVKDPNGRAYNRTAHLKERKKMMQVWADYIDKLKAGADILHINTN